MSSDLLPPEIWREIVTISATTSFQQATRLALVSPSFRNWVKPVLCRTAMHYRGHEGREWPSPAPRLEWFEQNGPNLRNLMWGHDDQMDLLASILEHCPALENLAVWVHAPSSNIPLVRPALSKLRLRQLSINLFVLLGVTQFGVEQATDPMFQCLTHLHVINHSSPLDWWHIEGLANIPTVTHVALQSTAKESAIKGVLENCKSLKVLVGVGCSSYGEADPKYVDLPTRSLDEWEAGALGGEDRFREAEIEVAKRIASKDIVKGAIYPTADIGVDHP
ncbi:hypothetical protein BDN72DRAFT_845122 [Pluteus cervinus]|uniref:Uncharacterized protein n=1 Tax=Pluteus cervinus TaxID=181527 RepID=A0ACD3ALN1_9AGAR|nr:hypothetical protein BDN72DRAFT_845122 [Pluteus cervinus]